MTIYRNTAVCGGQAFQRLRLGRMLAGGQVPGLGEARAGGSHGAPPLGHNEEARSRLLRGWINGESEPGGGSTSLRAQRGTMELLTRLYGQLACSARSGGLQPRPFPPPPSEG